jgi:hypothetical protein
MTEPARQPVDLDAVRRNVDRLAAFVDSRAREEVHVTAAGLHSNLGQLLRTTAYAHGAVQTAIAAGRPELAADQLAHLVTACERWRSHPEFAQLGITTTRRQDTGETRTSVDLAAGYDATAIGAEANALAGFVRDRATEVSRVGNLSLTDTVTSILMKAAYALGQVEAGLVSRNEALATRQLDFLRAQANTWRSHSDHPNRTATGES